MKVWQTYFNVHPFRQIEFASLAHAIEKAEKNLSNKTEKYKITRDRVRR